MSETSLAVSPMPYSKASTRGDDGPVSGLGSCAGALESLLLLDSAFFLKAMMLTNVGI